ncbi:hypothetical protein ABCR94_36050 [Streptomyces sp. 21So2-11]
MRPAVGARRGAGELAGTSPSTYRTAFRSLVADLTWSEREEAGPS